MQENAAGTSTGFGARTRFGARIGAEKRNIRSLTLNLNQVKIAQFRNTAEMSTRTGPEHDSKDMTARIGRPEQNSRDRTDRQNSKEHDNMDRTAGTEKMRDRSADTGSRDRTGG
jgi:hypothetical protein